jgi:hypothetical protein
MRGRYTRFLSDGLPLFGADVGGLGLLQIPPTDLGQVEVIKGGTGEPVGRREIRSTTPPSAPAPNSADAVFASASDGDAVVVGNPARSRPAMPGIRR